MASGIYNRLKANFMNKEVDLESDTIKIALMDENHSFSKSDNELSDVNANEITGPGYSEGGESLSNKSVTQDDTTKWDADDVTWEDGTFTTYHAVIYDGSLSNDDLICSIDFGGEQNVDGVDFTVKFDEDGIITLS